MEYTDEYVHINYVSSPTNAAGVTEVVINHNNDRAPYALVEVISATIHSDTDVNTTFVVMTEEIAVNVRNTANMGTTLSLVDYVAPLDNAGGADFVYQLLRQGTKALYSNTRTLHFYFTTAAGVPILPADGTITGYNVLLKISRPVVGSIQPSYREQIPL
tara:strand:+ start:1702 stop:2181 length:480 start_codon:yes stop_codon:yes gene_type:complete